jgi:hypothetical protein
VQSDVVITGFRLNAKEPAQKALERILGLSPDAARALSRSWPAVVMEGVANDNALRIRDQLERAGALVELRQARLAALDLPAPPRGGAFDLDLDLPMGGGGVGSAKANKSGTGAFAAVPKTGPGGFAAAKLPPSKPTAAPKTSSHLAVPMAPPTRSGNPQNVDAGRRPREQNTTARASLPQPPPPPAAAYQLGDFGVSPRGQSVVAKLPTAPSMPQRAAPSPHTLADGDFDFDGFGGGGGIELDLGTGPRQSLPRKPSQAKPSQPMEEEVLGERFGALEDPNAKAPEVDAVAFRSIAQQQPQRRVESRRPAKKKLDLLQHVPVVSLLVLLALTALTLAAVGYALDPADPLGGLARAQALPVRQGPDELEHQQGYLHPMLRSTPRALRAPVAAILRAQIQGVHDVSVGFLAEAGQTAQCVLVEHGTDTEARLARVRATGREVNATPTAAAQMIEHERALRASMQRLDLQFTRVCLVP